MNLLKGPAPGNWAESSFQKQSQAQEAALTLAAYLYAGSQLSVLRRRGWPWPGSEPQPAGTSHHPGIFCDQGLCMAMTLCLCGPGQPPSAAVSLPSVVPKGTCPIQAVLGCRRRGSEEWHHLAFWTFVSLILISSATRKKLEEEKMSADQGLR